MSNEETFSSLPAELRETMDRWSYITINELKLSMVANGMHLGDLYRSFTRQTVTDANGMPTKISIGFLYHGKFVDMGVGNGQKMENIKTNREVWANLSRASKKGKKRRKPKKWYSPTMYHEYQRAAEILAGKYGIEIPARFEKLFSERIVVNA